VCAVLTTPSIAWCRVSQILPVCSYPVEPLVLQPPTGAAVKRSTTGCRFFFKLLVHKFETVCDGHHIIAVIDHL
jgi:hypothetical protein